MTVGDRHYWRCNHCQATFLAAEQLPGPEFERERYELHENDPNDDGYRQFLHRLADPLLSRLAPPTTGIRLWMWGGVCLETDVRGSRPFPGPL